MHELSTKPSPYSPCMNIPSRCPAFDRNAIEFKKRKNQSDITNSNKKLRKRFQSAKPTYNTKQMMKESSYNDYLKHNISNFTINPNIKYATYNQFKKNLTIAIERETINPYYDSKHDVSCFTSINNNKDNNNFSTISAVRPNSSRTYVQRTILHIYNHIWLFCPKKTQLLPKISFRKWLPPKYVPPWISSIILSRQTKAIRHILPNMSLIFSF